MYKIDTLYIESTQAKSELCLLGGKYGTDKSPFNSSYPSNHRHPYTAIYNTLFANLKYAKITLGEIGILNNASMKCWREFFPNAKLIGYEYNLDYLEQAIQDKLKETSYSFMDVSNINSIQTGLQAAGELFDILIDDSTHNLPHQINVINTAYKFLKPGGILIIEDVLLEENHINYENQIEQIAKYFSHSTFIVADHANKLSWNNDKLLILFRNNVEA
jgi:hypothetical protein